MKDGLSSRVRNFFNPPPDVTPTNGLQSFRWLKYDLLVGIIMTPIAYVFALSISRIAHMSAISGIESGILACCLMWLFSNMLRNVFPSFGRGSWLLIAGPAAALAPILAEAVDKLGKGDLAAGQLLVLPVIMTAGIGMFAVALFGLTRFTTMASKAVCAGSILAYVGSTIIIKQIPVFFGVKFHDGSVSGTLLEAPSHTSEINWLIFGIGTLTAAMLLVHKNLKRKLEGNNSTGVLGSIAWALPKSVQDAVCFLPAPFTATMAALVMGYMLTLENSTLVQLPNTLFTEGFTPGVKGWEMLFADPSLWHDYGWSSFKLFMVDTIEICGTVLAIDTLDKYHRRSNLNNMLMAMAVANMAGGCAGTQSNIPGGMKSTSAWSMGAKTINTAGVCGALMFLVVIFDGSRKVVEHMPLVSLGAVIAFVGWHLCEPKVWKQFRSPGKTLLQEFTKPGQFFVFISGFGLSLFTGDILWGFFGAILIELAINYRHIYRTAKLNAHNGASASQWAILKKIFGNPVESDKMEGGIHVVKLRGPVSTFNRRFLPECPEGATDVYVDADHPEVTYICGDTEEFFRKTRKRVCGKDHFKIDDFIPSCPSGRPGSGLERATQFS